MGLQNYLGNVDPRMGLDACLSILFFGPPKHGEGTITPDEALMSLKSRQAGIARAPSFDDVKKISNRPLFYRG